MPVPTLTSRSSSRPVGQPRWYAGSVAIRTSWSAGLLSVVTAPSLNTNVWPPTSTSSGTKNVGAAELARTSCHSGRSRLEPGPWL